MGNPNFSIKPSEEGDMPRCAEIMSTAFADEVTGPLLFGRQHDAASFAKVAAVHWRAHTEHVSAFPSYPFAIKCVHTDPATGAETIVGTAEWAIYDRERSSEAEWRLDPYSFRCEYVEPESDRLEMQAILRPLVQARQEFVRGRRYGFLLFMAVDPAWRRQGAATACIRWGMDRCRELGIPTYLDATQDGMKTYKSLGWETVDLGGSPQYPPMMWWPEGVEKWTD